MGISWLAAVSRGGTTLALHIEFSKSRAGLVRGGAVDVPWCVAVPGSQALGTEVLQLNHRKGWRRVIVALGGV